MPIWLELLILSLTAYAAGLGLGWILWRGVAGSVGGPGGGEHEHERRKDG